MKKSRNFAALVFYKKTNINRKKNCRLKPMDFEMRYIEERKIDEASAEVTIDVTFFTAINKITAAVALALRQRKEAMLLKTIRLTRPITSFLSYL